MKCFLYYEAIQWPCSREEIRQRWGLWEVRRFGVRIQKTLVSMSPSTEGIVAAVHLKYS